MSQFKVHTVKSLLWPITVQVPVDCEANDDGQFVGQSREHHFVGKFAMITDAEFQTLFIEGGDVAVLNKVLKAVGNDKDNLTANKNTFKEMLALPFYRKGIFEAYQDFLLGGQEKN
ncbi:hypothetical protein tloyanaT_26280 [Thalassotalea loyana]|uniref:Uncharacterized protein n=1 Tax=Thalassotalea loyana TaxID=280483 RepID=A0ABQ6HFV7_9GAMM|nr:hypothetical protein [Thalassotalea loyana]GLX86375.1 hypothetical protein tloyanaT_26280 [Thalassotalea loyana]